MQRGLDSFATQNNQQNIDGSEQVPPGQVDQPNQNLTKKQIIAQEDAAAADAGRKALLASNGNMAVALKAQQDAKKTMQRERELQQKQEFKEKSESIKEDRIEKRELRKENRDVETEVIKDFKTAKEEDKDLDRMSALIKTKNLTRPRLAGFYKILEKGGLNLQSTLTPESQEFEKLSTGFLKNLKSYFGSKITQIEVESFLKTLPTLMQSREGKKRVIFNMKLNNEAKKVRHDAYIELKNKYKGNYPESLENMIQEKVDPQLTKLADRFSKGRPAKKPKSFLSKIGKGFTGSTGILDKLLGKG